MARWYQDGTNLGVFGPKLGDDNYQVRDLVTEKLRITKAANFYYNEWKRVFDGHNLTPYVCVGDHMNQVMIIPGKSFRQTDAFLVKRNGRETVLKYRELFAQHFC